MAYKKAKKKPPLQPRKCDKCEKIFVPKEHKHKLCSFGCASAKWGAIVAKVESQLDTESDGDDLEGDPGEVPF